MYRREPTAVIASLICSLSLSNYSESANRGPLDPRGRIHTPIGIANTVDTLKTFVEAEGNREAGYDTLHAHLEHPQMRGWYAFDEGGKNGSGGWRRVRTTWNGNVAMPHGWAIAELWLLLRDCLAFENEGRLVLLSGIPPAWFTHPEGIGIGNLPTYFGSASRGKLNLTWEPVCGGAMLRLNGQARPPKGFVLRLPPALGATVTVHGTAVAPSAAGEFVLPSGTTKVKIRFSSEYQASN